MLIALDPHTLVNASTIASIKMKHTDEGREVVTVTLTDGTTKRALARFEDLEALAWPIVPAPPGYSVIQAFPPDKDGDPTTFDSVPVFAFRITDREPMPLTAWGRLGDTWALVWPDGRTDEQWNRIWPSVEAFKASFGPRGVRSGGDAS